MSRPESAAAPTTAATLAHWIDALRPSQLPPATARACADTVLDTVGLSIGASGSDYVEALRRAWPSPGPCTVLGSTERREAGAAAVINGTAAHGEDFDNTFEGCPVHTGAVVVPAVLAAAEAARLSGPQTLKGLAVGLEIMCRLGLLAQKGPHTAGFHPTAVLGALAATAAVAAARGSKAPTTVNALGIAGSLASGIIEYLADGSSTKRLHAGWAAHNGLRAVAMAEAGFTGPASVFEGRHGALASFAPSIEPDFEILTGRLGTEWHSEQLAFKPYACGTMTQPFIDCAIRLAGRIEPERISALTCFVGEGTVHRLWEPLASKRRPPNPYAAKFSTPYCVAVGLLRGAAGLAEFSEETLSDPHVLAIAARVGYEVDPNDEYPRNYTGRIRATLTDGRSVEEFQPCLRGGRRAPLGRDALLAKCTANLRYAGLAPARAETAAAAIAAFADGLGRADGRIDLAARLEP